MEKFCDFITNPDWWSVVATIIAAIVAAVITYVLGKRQNELQEQQLKIQERQNELQAQQVKLQEQQNIIQGYEMHRMMFHFVHETTAFADTFLFEIQAFLIERQANPQCERLDKLKQRITQMDNEFNDRFVDINIHLSVLDAFEYDDMICSMKGVIDELEVHILQNNIKDNVSIAEPKDGYGDEYFTNSILTFLKEDFDNKYEGLLQEFVEIKDGLVKEFSSYLSGQLKDVSF